MCCKRKVATCRPVQTKLGRSVQNSWALVGGMSSGKRNHENLSDEIALLEAALKARPHHCHAQPSAKVMQKSRRSSSKVVGKASGGWCTTSQAPRAPVVRYAGVANKCNTTREMVGRVFESM